MDYLTPSKLLLLNHKINNINTVKNIDMELYKQVRYDINSLTKERLISWIEHLNDALKYMEQERDMLGDYIDNTMSS